MGRDFDLVLVPQREPQILQNSQNAVIERHFSPLTKRTRKIVDPGTSPNGLNEALVQARAPFSLFAMMRKRHQNDLPKTPFLTPVDHKISLSPSFLDSDFITFFRTSSGARAQAMGNWGLALTAPEALPLLI